MEVREGSSHGALKVSQENPRLAVLPRGWKSVRLAQIAEKRANSVVGGPFGSNLVSRDYVADGVPVVRGQNMSQHYVSGDFAFVSVQKAQQLQANLARPDDVLFTQRGTLGQVSIVPNAPYAEYVISQSQMKLTPNKELACSEYFYQYFASDLGQRQVLGSAIQTGVPHTNLGIFRAYLIPLPESVLEQQNIAEALNDTDTLIESLEHLLVKKRQIKQGAMQELLTGERRLPGFRDEWCTRKLGEIGSFRKGRGVNRDQASSGTIPCVRYGEIYTAHQDRIVEFGSWISADVAAEATLMKQGDLEVIRK
jgi:type I restriction enzyme, S subunit